MSLVIHYTKTWIRGTRACIPNNIYGTAPLATTVKHKVTCKRCLKKLKGK